MPNTIKLDFTLLMKIIKQLIYSDGIEITNEYLIQQGVHYIDNVGIIEELEKQVIMQIYSDLYAKGNVNREKVLNIYSPTYINYDKLLDVLEREHKHKESDNTTLNEYL